MPPAAFVAVSRLPPPPFECQLLPPLDVTEPMVMNGTMQSPEHNNGSDDEATSSLLDYQRQTIAMSSVLLPSSNATYDKQPT